MRISKEKLDKLKKGSRRAGRAIAAGGKSTVYEGGAGAVAAYAAQMLDTQFAAVGSRPWAKGAILVGIGHVLKKRKSMGTIGAALVGAGGYALGLHLRNRSASAPAAQTSTPVLTGAPETKGLYDGYGYDTADTGMVVRSAALNV